MGCINTFRALSAISMGVAITEVVFLLHAQENINFGTKVKKIYRKRGQKLFVIEKRASLDAAPKDGTSRGKSPPEDDRSHMEWKH